MLRVIWCKTFTLSKETGWCKQKVLVAARELTKTTICTQTSMHADNHKQRSRSVWCDGRQESKTGQCVWYERKKQLWWDRTQEATHLLRSPWNHQTMPSHSTHDSSQTEWRRSHFSSPATVSALVKGSFHTCNFGMDQTKEVGTTMITSESTARGLRSTCADQASIYRINNGCGAWISSPHVSVGTSVWAHTVTGAFARCDLWYRVCYFRIRAHR